MSVICPSGAEAGENNLDKYNKLFWKYIYDKPDSAYFYANEALQHTDANDLKYLSMFANNIGIYYYFTDRLDSAKIFYNRAIGCAKQGGDPTQTAKVLNNLAIIYDIQGDYDTAINNYRQALSLHAGMGNSKQVAECFNNIAVVYKLKGDYENALACHQKSTAILDSMGKEEGMAFNYNNMGLIESDRGKPQDAMRYYALASDIFQKLEEPIEQASVLLNMANEYKILAVYDLAFEYYEKAIEIYRDKKQLSGVGICLINIAELQHQNKEDENARKNLGEAISLFKEIEYAEKIFDATINLASLEIDGQNFFRADSLLGEAMQIAVKMDTPENMGIASFYTGMLNFKQGNFRKSYGYFETAYGFYEQIGLVGGEGKALLMQAKTLHAQNKNSNVAKLALKAKAKGMEDGNVLLQKECAFFLTGFFEKRTDYKQFARFLGEYHRLKDSLVNIENVRHVTAFQLKTEHGEKMAEQKLLAEKEQVRLSSEVEYQKRARNILLVFSFLLLLSLTAIFVLYRKRDSAYKMLVEKNKELVRAYSRLTKKDKKSGKQQKIKLSSDKGKLLIKIKYYLEDEKKYLSPNLKVSDVSKDLETNSSYISQIINNEYGKNFNHFVNDLRVQEACKLFHKGKYRENTIEGIAQMTGFNNRATFISAFKKYTGVTPSFYIKSIEREQGVDIEALSVN